jgi:tetratricopeptide (TPR) repeat protein
VRLTTCWLALAACCAAPQTFAREQAEEFVAALNERGLQELALDYLQQMETSPLADAAFRKRIPYHRGIVLIAQARQTPDADQRAALFQQASRELDQFVAANPENPAAADALLELANVLVDQAKQMLAEARQIPDETAYADERERLQQGARRLLADAQPKFLQAEQFYSVALDAMPKTLDPKTQSELIVQRQEYRGRLAQVSVLAAQAEFEAASTYPSKSDDFTKRHAATAKKLSDLYEKYSRWLVGFYARLYEGRCYQALGDYQRALGCYEELISQSSVHPAFRKLIAAAYGYQAQCLLAQGKFDAAIANATLWSKDAQDGEADTPEWLLVRFELAEALRAKAEAADTKPSEKRGLIVAAGDAYRAVAAVPNEFQGPARAAVAALGPSDRPPRDVPRDFAAAYQAGKIAMTSVNVAKMALPSAAKNNPAAIPQLRQQMEQGEIDARRDFRLALSLVDDDTNRDQLNEVRYFLCWLYWDNGDYLSAAVLGEFLARRYSDHPAAAASAKLALASYEQLQQQAGRTGQKADVEFEARKMADVAEFITRRWPDTQAAETAYRVLISYALRTDRIDEAKDLLDQVSPAARPALEAQLGNAMWARYLTLSQQNKPSPADDKSLDQLHSDAIKFMQNGYDAARTSGKPTEVSATAGLYLAQAQLNAGKHAEALRLLEDPKVGPLTLVREKHNSAARPEFVVETYKAALRADVSVTPPRIEQAIKLMKGLEAAAADGGSTSPDQLMRIYVSLAMSLSEQLERLRESGAAADVARLSSALSELLDHMGRGPSDSSWATRYWIAQTYLSLGKSLPPRAAQPHFVKARGAFEALAAEAEKNPEVLPSANARLAVEKQLGDCFRVLGDYQKALNAFSQVLAEQESQISVQQAAARTYQQWGAAGGGTRKLERAIYGGYKLRSTGKNRIWGWLKLALVAEQASRTDPKYEDVFFEARLEAARSRYLIGAKSEGTERQQSFATAKQSIRSMLQLYPKLGGERWRDQYEELLKQIQQASGESPDGLKEFAAAP